MEEGCVSELPLMGPCRTQKHPEAQYQESSKDIFEIVPTLAESSLLLFLLCLPVCGLERRTYLSSDSSDEDRQVNVTNFCGSPIGYGL